MRRINNLNFDVHWAAVNVLSIIPQHSDGAGSGNHSLWKAKKNQSHILNTMTADVPMTQWAKSCEVVLLSQPFPSFLVSAPNWLNRLDPRLRAPISIFSLGATSRFLRKSFEQILGQQPLNIEMLSNYTFVQNIGFNMVPSDPFMSHLATQLGYSAGEFHAVQLIVLAAFGVVN